MIEKLNVAYIQVESDSNAKLELANKINELVDAVNELQEAFESIHPCLKYKDLNKTPVDPYAEQRKWIGCCKRYI